MRLDSNVISRANPMNLIIRFRVGLEGHCLISSFAIILELFGYDMYFWMYVPYIFHNVCYWNWLVYVFVCLCEGVDIDALTNCAIKAARILGDVSGNAASCAELSIYLMLGLLRKHIGLFNLIPDSHSSFLIIAQ